MGDSSRNQRAGAVQPLHVAVRVFVVFCVLLALVGALSFWPPRSFATAAWVLVWALTCLSTAMAIVWRSRHAPALVWGLIVLAGYSAVSAYRAGWLGGVGILIDIALFIPLIWFALWYQRRRRIESAAPGPPGSSR